MEPWRLFEYYCIDFHIRKYNHTVWHSSVIPEDELYKAGFIHNYNKIRLHRLALLRESKGNPIKYADYGMDFLAKDSNGLYFAGQAKQYTKRKVSANDLGTFFSVLASKIRNCGYLYTTSKLEINLHEDILNARGKWIVHHRLSDFNPEINKNDKPIEEIQYPLRPYQVDAINAIIGPGRKVVDIACGLGKTLIAGHVLKQSSYKHIVCIAPLKVSVDQLMNRIKPFLPQNYQHLLVDSDSQGITDSEFIKNAINKNEHLVIYSTFKSATDILSKLLNGEEYLIVDEVHNALSISEFCNMFKNSLFMSATVPEELYDVFDNVEKSFSYGMAEGIQNGYICDYNVFLPYINDQDKELSCSDVQNDIMAKVEFLSTGMLKTGARRCIVYLKNCSECPDFMTKFMNHMNEYHGIIDVWCEKIDNTVNTKERSRILDYFQNDTKNSFYIIVSVRILDEAIDIPRCDSEFITHVGDATSDIRTVQRLQRGGRLDKDNLLKVNNMFMWCDDWSKAIRALSLLKSSDINFHKKIKIMNGNYDEGFSKEKLVNEKTILLNQFISVHCLSIEERWKMKYDLLKEFVREHNRIPTYKEEYQGVNIGKWCEHQRTNYKNDKLDNDKKEDLERIDGWYWGEKRMSKPLTWKETYEVLKEFVREHNRIPTYKEEYQGVNIGKWCEHQRTNYKNDKLNEDKKENLERITGWTWGEKSLTWNETYNILQGFVREHNKIPSQKEEYQGVNIGMWCNYQRQNYKNDKLDKDRKEDLEKITGWTWGEKSLTWKETYEVLQEYVKEHNRVPTAREEYQGVKIGNWCHTQRTNYKNDKLDKDRKEDLEKITGWYWKKSNP